jgi:hypothetical protein
LRSLHGMGEGRCGAHDAVAREEATALPVRCGRKEKGGGGTRPGGMARPAWPLGAGWAGLACLAARPKRSGGLAGPEAKRAAGSAGPKIRKKKFSN